MNPRNILLADDDGDDCMLFEEAVSELEIGVSLETVHNGEALLTHLKRGGALPDVIFLDLNMPRVSGFECLREIKQDDNLKKLPVIIISTSFDPTNIQKLRAAGAACYIRKPNRYGDLVKVIDKSLQVVFNSVQQSPNHEFVIFPGLI